MYVIQNLNLMNIRNQYHLFFISLILMNYLFPLLIFNQITLFYHDNLDSIIVYNHILGKIYKGDPSSIDIFLSGKISIEYLRHLMNPYSLLYALFNTELAYWIIDFLVKITCYFSFYSIARKINNNFFLCSLISCLFACTNIRTTDGFGTAIFPYLIYLILYKQNLSLKHYIIIIFSGLNTDLVKDIYAIPFIILVIFIINKKFIIEKLRQIIKVSSLFFISIIISNLNLIYSQLFSSPFHRDEFFREPISFLNNLYIFFIDLFRIPIELTWTFFYNLPYVIFLVPLILLSFFSKNKIVQKFLILIFLVHFFQFFLNLEIITNVRNNASGFIKNYHFTWIQSYLPILYVFLFTYLIKEKENSHKFLIYPTIISILFFQINSSMLPIAKKYVLKEGNDYENIYTFKGYYSKESYREIKNVVGNKRVLSVGLDPMVAVMNNIKTIDGYHALYPLSYKKKFRTVIQEELEKNENLQKYYDHWGSRVYAFTSNPNNIKINFKAAKKIGADYVISKFNLNSDDLVLKCKKCRNNLYLYEIE